MATVIFKWNPAFSSYTMHHYLADMINLREYDEFDYNWSVWDHDKIHKDDRFFLVKVGMYGQTGIVASGEITSEPYESEDWSGRGRQTFYVDFLPDVLLNPDALPILTCAQLIGAIPDFEWNRGHSGLVLTAEQAEKLEALWQKHLATLEPDFQKPRRDTYHDICYRK